MIIDAFPEKSQALPIGEYRIHRGNDIEVAAHQCYGKQVKGVMGAPNQRDKGIHQLEQAGGAEAGDPEIHKMHCGEYIFCSFF